MLKNKTVAILALAQLMALAVPGAPAEAQDTQAWLDDVFGDPRTPTRSRRSERRAAGEGDARAWDYETLLKPATVKGLDDAIRAYEAIVRRGGWARIPGRQALKPGADGARVVALKRRLMITGDLPAQRRISVSYDRRTEEAVAAYQRRIGLTASGVVNARTLAMLNVPATQRLRQLRLNRDRIGGLLWPAQAGRYILVNIPAYHLQAVERGNVVISSRVIVGKPSTPTPEISAKVKALNTLPYWHVPKSIAERALIPKVKDDINYLDREQIRVFSSWGGEELDPHAINWWSPQGQRLVFRQDPGPFNALGVIRLDMPNKEIVYMHDTPLKRLFNYAMRPYSAGCVRVQNVLDVAGWLAERGAGIDKAQIVRAINAGQQETIKLAEPVPVFFAYISAWVTRDRTVHFRADIYDKDAEGAQVAGSAPWDKADVRVTP